MVLRYIAPVARLVLAEVAHEHGGDLGAGSGAGGLELAVVAALEQAGRNRPGHRILRVVADAAGIREAGQARARADIVADILRIAIKYRRKLLAGNCTVRVEQPVIHASNYAVRARPDYRVGVPGVRRDVAERVRAPDRGLADRAVDHRHQHGAGGRFIRPEDVRVKAVHDAVAVGVHDRVVEPVVSAHVVERELHRTLHEAGLDRHGAGGHLEGVHTSALGDVDELAVLGPDGDAVEAVALVRGHREPDGTALGGVAQAGLDCAVVTLEHRDVVDRPDVYRPVLDGQNAAHIGDGLNVVRGVRHCRAADLDLIAASLLHVGGTADARLLGQFLTSGEAGHGVAELGHVAAGVGFGVFGGDGYLRLGYREAHFGRADIGRVVKSDHELVAARVLRGRAEDGAVGLLPSVAVSAGDRYFCAVIRLGDRCAGVGDGLAVVGLARAGDADAAYVDRGLGNGREGQSRVEIVVVPCLNGDGVGVLCALGREVCLAGIGDRLVVVADVNAVYYIIVGRADFLDGRAGGNGLEELLKADTAGLGGGLIYQDVDVDRVRLPGVSTLHDVRGSALGLGRERVVAGVSAGE